METILLGVTTVSMLVALVMSAIAWRLAREERARSAARVAALATAAGEPPSSGVSPAAVIPAPVAVSPSLVMNEAAARTPRTPARGTLAIATATVPVERGRPADLTLNAAGDDELPLRPTVAPWGTSGGAVRPSERFDYVTPAPIRDTFLSTPAAREEGSRQRGLMVAAAALLVVLGGGAYWALSGDHSVSEAASAAAPATSAPLELISLRPQRQGSRLTLSGLVKNPAAGAPIDGLTAVVFLFDAQGGFISSARAGIDFKRLAPGDESPFVITADAPSNVARYRVSFRTDAGIVAHVDRRAEPPVTTSRM